MRLILILVASVMLSGCIGAIVAGAAGVASVAHDRRTVEAQVGDSNIEIKVNSKVSEIEDGNPAADIGVVSYNFRVLLYGQVESLEQKNRAEQLAKSVANVREVFNELRLASPAESSATADTALTAEIKSRFVAEKGLDATRIKTVTEASEVFLMGIVTQAEAAKAVAVARNVDGVEKVVKVFEYID